MAQARALGTGFALAVRVAMAATTLGPRAPRPLAVVMALTMAMAGTTPGLRGPQPLGADTVLALGHNRAMAVGSVTVREMALALEQGAAPQTARVVMAPAALTLAMVGMVGRMPARVAADQGRADLGDAINL